jgi:hypothetical protein
MYDPDFGGNKSRPSLGISQDSGATKISVSALHRAQISSSRRSSRPTRNANFHQFPGTIAEEFEEEFGEEEEIVHNFDFDDEASGHRPDANHHRPHFLNLKTMRRLRQLLILGGTSGAFPWVWNKKTNRIDKWSTKMERFWYYMWAVTTVQTTILTGFQIYSFFARMTNGQKTYRDIFMMSFSFYW